MIKKVEKNRYILRCDNCGNKTSCTEKSVFIYDLDEARLTVIYYILQCESCGSPLIFETSDWEGEPENPETWTQLYPVRVIYHETIPKEIIDNLQSAHLVKNINLEASAVLMRRSLECFCAEQNVTGNTLVTKLHRLREKGILPPAIADASYLIKQVGNIGAHITGKKLTLSYISAVEKFLKSTLDYVYVLPAEIKKLTKELEKLVE